MDSVIFKQNCFYSVLWIFKYNIICAILTYISVSWRCSTDSHNNNYYHNFDFLKDCRKLIFITIICIQLFQLPLPPLPHQKSVVLQRSQIWHITSNFCYLKHYFHFTVSQKIVLSLLSHQIFCWKFKHFKNVYEQRITNAT